jgi:hypothetical protein
VKGNNFVLSVSIDEDDVDFLFPGGESYGATDVSVSGGRISFMTKGNERL